MKRAGAIFLTMATLVFIASMFAYGVQPLLGAPAIKPLVVSDTAFATHVDVTALFLRPVGPALSGLMALTWAALGYHAVLRVQEARRLHAAEIAPQNAGGRRLALNMAGPPSPGQILRTHRDDNSLREHGPLLVALIVGAMWPWLLRALPLTAFLLAVAMLIGFLSAALRGVRRGDRIERSTFLSFAAGWATMVTFAMFVSLLQQRLGASLFLSAAVGMALAAVAVVCVQLRLGRTVSFSVAVIWGLIGVAAGTVAVNAGLATLAVLAITIIVFGLVQVTT